MRLTLYSIILYHLCSNGVRSASLEKQRHSVERRQNPLSTGPVLFPNVATSPTPRPLIVTSRPLTQQINRSDQRGAILIPKRPSAGSESWNQLENEIDNRGIGADLIYDYGDEKRYLQNQPIRLLPLQVDFADPTKNSSLLDKHPYAAVAKKLKHFIDARERGYNSFERQTVLPPIYTALTNYAKTKVLKSNVRTKYKSIKVSNKGDARNFVKGDGDDDEYYNDNFGNEAKQYAFSYSVRDHQTGDDFSHSQRQSGSATNGEYRVKLPDGRLQIVSYTADNGGYKAEVRYEEDPEEQRQNAPEQKLGRIIVPSKEDVEYDDYFYDEKPKEVLITSKPVYLHTTPSTPTVDVNQYENSFPTSTPSPLVYAQEDRNSYRLPEYVSGFSRFPVLTTTPAPFTTFDRLGPLDSQRGQQRYTTVAPLLFGTTPSGPTYDLRQYFTYSK